MDPSESIPDKRERSFLPPRVEILRLDFSRFARSATTQVTREREAEVGRVVSRLLAIVREHRASARRVGSPLGQRDLKAVVEALRIESSGGDPRPLLHHPEPVATWLRQALFEDLLEGVLRSCPARERWCGIVEVLEGQVSEG